jgi:hypothetical protein
MSKKGLTILTAALTALLFVAFGGLTTAADEQEVPDQILLDNEYERDKKGPVEFTHKKHEEDYGIACADCHHVYEDGENVWKEGDHVEKCSACHTPEGEADGPMKLQNAFHRNCKNCHKDLFKEKKPTGPFRKCNDCHQKS